MTLVICPGVHPSVWTHSFLNQLDDQLAKQLPTGKQIDRVIPTHQNAPWSAYALRTFMESQMASHAPLIFVAFSAGCVAAMGVARYWVEQGRPVAAVIALDGWGLPVTGPFDTYRLSHDAFTHQTSAYLGAGNKSFYADPPVSHQYLWCQPAQVTGWQVNNLSADPRSETPTTALAFLVGCLSEYPEALVRWDSGK